MTIQEAIQSGQAFGRRGKIKYFGSSKLPRQIKEFSLDDVLAEDWEIEEETIEITRSLLHKAILRCHTDHQLVWGYTNLEESPEQILAQELGFKSS